jgi:membrane protein implicated in regulation of membrane protease activity
MGDEACFICLESAPISRKDKVVTSLCKCKSLAVHMSCLESMVNSHGQNHRPINERLMCTICRSKYRVGHRLVPGAVTSGGVFHTPKDVWERTARRLTDDPDRVNCIAGALVWLAIVAAFVVIGGVFVLGMLLWSYRSNLHVAIIVLLAVVFCIPYLRIIPQQLYKRAQREGHEGRWRARRSRSSLPVHGAAWHIRLEPPASAAGPGQVPIVVTARV